MGLSDVSRSFVGSQTVILSRRSCNTLDKDENQTV